MEVNLTFCVQVINFIFFYFCIRRFLLEPFVRFIQAKIKLREQFLQEFSEKEAHLKSLMHRKTELAQDFKKMLKTRYVFPEEFVEPSFKDGAMDDGVSEDQKNASIKCLTQKIVSRIRDAY